MSGSLIGSYRLGETLGVGTFGKVKLAIHEKTGVKVAVKITNKLRMKSMDMNVKLRREIAIVHCLHHPHVIRLYELIDTPMDIFMVMEYVPGGELFDYIVQRNRLQEPDARRFFQQIVSAVEYCHNHTVCHRDLKPENILLDEHLNAKVGDFGLSNFMKNGDFLSSSCGSPNYASPEVVTGKPYAGPEIDIWSCAVILYALLCGTLPFDDDLVPNLFKKITDGIYSLPGHLSEQSRNLIMRMLVVDPTRRLTLKEIRRHPWFRVNLPPLLSSATLLRMYTHTGLDASILRELQTMGYDVDIENFHHLDRVDGEMSKIIVAYQLLADRRANTRLVSFGDGRFLRQFPFAFSREIQKRIVAASLIVDPEITPFHWISNGVMNSATGYQFQQPTLNPLELYGIPARRPQQSETAYGCSAPLDWPVGNPAWIASKWKLGVESSLESAIIVTAILNTLKALNYEWRLITPYKIRCRAIRKNELILSECRSPSVPEKHENTSPTQDPNDHQKAMSLSPCPDGKCGVTTSCACPEAHDVVSTLTPAPPVMICIQLYEISAARYLIDVQLFDGPAFVSIAESLWLISAIYSSLTQIQLQDSPGGAISRRPNGGH